MFFRPWLLASAAALVLGLGAGRATAAELTVTSRTVYHAYKIRLLPDGDALRNLNRFYSTLDLGGWSLGPAANLDAVISLRYGTDFGTGFHRDTPADQGLPAVDGRDDVDLMYAYVDWRNVVPGLLDLRAGRQLLVDDLFWYSLDGLKLTGHLWHEGQNAVDVELYAGFPVRFDLLFSSDPFTLDGTEVDDASSPFSGLAFGGSANTRVLDDLSISIAYRQELEIRGDAPAAFRVPDASDPAADLRLLGGSVSAGKMGLQESRFGASIGYTIRPLALDLYGHLDWDLLLGNLEQARTGVSWSPTLGTRAQLEYLRVLPRFAGDSIFNYFNIFPYDRARAAVTVELIHGVIADAGYFLQIFHGSESTADREPSNLTHGPSLGVRYQTLNWSFGGSAEAGTNTGGDYAFGGNYRLFDLFGSASFLEGRAGADAHFLVTSFQDDWFAGNKNGAVTPVDSSYIASLGARGQITEFLAARLMFAKNFSSPLEGNYRVYSELTVRY